jgi:hypothetical protein
MGRTVCQQVKNRPGVGTCQRLFQRKQKHALALRPGWREKSHLPNSRSASLLEAPQLEDRSLQI